MVHSSLSYGIHQECTKTVLEVKQLSYILVKYSIFWHLCAYSMLGILKHMTYETDLKLKVICTDLSAVNLV